MEPSFALGLGMLGPGWLFGIGLLAIAGFAYYAYQRGQRRLATFAQWAATTGWVLVPQDRALPDRWNRYPFGVGESRRAVEVLHGTWSQSAAVSLTYHFTTGSGKERSEHVCHVVDLSLPAYLPELTLSPDGLGAKLSKLVGGQDLQFESEDFNRAWRVECADPKFAHDVVTPRLMERLLQPDARGLGLRINGTDVMCWSPGETQLDALAPRLGLLQTIRDAIPRFVWLDHGYDPGNG